MANSNHNLKIPTDREIFEGEIATYWFDEGVLVSMSKSTRRTVDVIRNNVALVKKITGNKPTPLLIYLADSPVPDKETRKYSALMLPEIYSAMAMVSKPGLAFLIMKMVFHFSQPPIPVKSFSDDREAKEWLKQYV